MDNNNNIYLTAIGLSPGGSTRAMLSGVQTDDGQPGCFLHMTEPSSRHCLTH